MLEAIRDVHDETGRIVGMKPAGGIRTAKQAIQYLVRPERDARRRLDDARPVPLRRLVAAQRRADADPQAAAPALPVRRLLHDRLMTELETSQTALPIPLEWEYAPAPEARDIVSLEERYGLFIGGELVEPRSRKVVHDDQAGDRGAARRGRAGGRPRTSTSPSARRATAFENGWSALRPPSARSTSSGSRGSCRSARASSRSPSRSTAASRSRSRATSTSRSPPRTSSTTRAGPTSSNTRSRTAAAPARRRRPDHPVELPAADAGVEDRAGARVPATRWC